MSTTTSNKIHFHHFDLKNLKLKTINLVIFGHGNVGQNLIQQVLEIQDKIIERRKIYLRIVAIANSTQMTLDANGLDKDWLSSQVNQQEKTDVNRVISFTKEHHLNHLILVDNTADEAFVAHYPTFVQNGFHLVSSNKIANTLNLQYYNQLRELLRKNNKQYLYETNVGAGLPLIDTIKLLHLSGENITQIRGVFSGSLSYIFNSFSQEDIPFSVVLKEAINKGLTEPDPREDLNGNDVARKLLILARELDLKNEFSDVQVQNLIPEPLRTIPKSDFFQRIEELDDFYQEWKDKLDENTVLRYIADLSGDLSKDDGAILNVQLKIVPKNSMVGALSGSDSIFEIYTENYGNHPITIQGAGAGSVITARGVLGDILRISEKC